MHKEQTEVSYLECLKFSVKKKLMNILANPKLSKTLWQYFLYKRYNTYDIFRYHTLPLKTYVTNVLIINLLSAWCIMLYTDSGEDFVIKLFHRMEWLVTHPTSEEGLVFFWISLSVIQPCVPILISLRIYSESSSF